MSDWFSAMVDIGINKIIKKSYWNNARYNIIKYLFDFPIDYTSYLNNAIETLIFVTGCTNIYPLMIGRWTYIGILHIYYD